MWEPRRLTTLWASMACCRDSFTFFTSELHSDNSSPQNSLRNKIPDIPPTQCKIDLVPNARHVRLCVCGGGQHFACRILLVFASGTLGTVKACVRTCLLRVGGRLMENNTNERAVLSGQLKGKLSAPNSHRNVTCPTWAGYLSRSKWWRRPSNPSSTPGRKFSRLHNVQTGSGTRLASCPVRTWEPFLRY
jgi:hypothetical protein